MRRLVPTAGVVLGFLLLSSLSYGQARHQAMNYGGNPGGVRYLEEGQRPAMIHPTVEAMEADRSQRPVQQASTANDLTYHGGVGGIGVETAPKIYLVLWGSQWNNNDPSGESAILQSFIRGSAAVRGQIVSRSTARECQLARSFATGRVCRPEIPLAFSLGSGPTTPALLLRTRANRNSPPKQCARLITSEIPLLPAMLALNT